MLRQFGYFTFDFPSKRKIPKIKVHLEKWKNGDLNMIDFTVFETNLKKYETLPSNNQHCNEKTTNRWNWTTFAIARNSGNKKVYIAKWKKNSGINNTFQN